MKVQRDQEQRRHEGQVQQLKVEIRTLNQTLIVKQSELTQVYQEQARTTAELAALKKELRREESERRQLELVNRASEARLAQSETAAATLAERPRQVEDDRDQGRRQIIAREAELKDSEAMRQQLQGIVYAQEGMLAKLTASGSDMPNA